MRCGECREASPCGEPGVAVALVYISGNASVWLFLCCGRCVCVEFVVAKVLLGSLSGIDFILPNSFVECLPF